MLTLTVTVIISNKNCFYLTWKWNLWLLFAPFPDTETDTAVGVWLHYSVHVIYLCAGVPFGPVPGLPVSILAGGCPRAHCHQQGDHLGTDQSLHPLPQELRRPSLLCAAEEAPWWKRSADPVPPDRVCHLSLSCQWRHPEGPQAAQVCLRRCWEVRAGKGSLTLASVGHAWGAWALLQRHFSHSAL